MCRQDSDMTLLQGISRTVLGIVDRKKTMSHFQHLSGHPPIVTQIVSPKKRSKSGKAGNIQYISSIISSYNMLETLFGIFFWGLLCKPKSSMIAFESSIRVRITVPGLQDPGTPYGPLTQRKRKAKRLMGTCAAWRSNAQHGGIPVHRPHNTHMGYTTLHDDTSMDYSDEALTGMLIQVASIAR